MKKAVTETGVGTGGWGGSDRNEEQIYIANHFPRVVELKISFKNLMKHASYRRIQTTRDGYSEYLISILTQCTANGCISWYVHTTVGLAMHH